MEAPRKVQAFYVLCLRKENEGRLDDPRKGFEGFAIFAAERRSRRIRNLQKLRGSSAEGSSVSLLFAC